MIKLLAIFVLTVPILQNTIAAPQNDLLCGYKSCPTVKDEKYLNLHIVAHTHDDVGWLKTYDEYYYGNNNTIQNAGVQYILDSVIQELLHDPDKRFIYVETAFFWKWWIEQNDATMNLVKKLVNRGQLEFVGGAWSMHDEAAAHYQSMLDQTTWGFRKLSDIFGECGRPRIGWQIDPFGHSKVNANLMAKYGFDGLFLGRIDWEDKIWRIKNQTMEMIWYTSSSDDSDSSKLFTGVLYNVYAPPKGFCFDVNCNDEPIVDNKNSPNYNAEQRAEEFVEHMMVYAKAYRTNNVLVTMGEDFHFQNAHMNFKNIDKLIKYVNMIEVNGMKMNAFYSTPSCYLKAVHSHQISLPSKSDDFLPYASDPYSFWTGYYTSRPTSKNFERMGNNFLQVCKQLHAVSKLGSTALDELSAMRNAMGIMQHHDAITGTEKQHVADDYTRILTDAFNQCGYVAQQAFNKLMPKKKTQIMMKSCLLLNISSCPIVEDNDNFVVTLYNPLSHPVNHLVKLPVVHETNLYTVLCPLGNEVDVQLIKLPEEIINIPGRTSKAKSQIAFIARDIPPLGYKSFYVSLRNETGLTKETIMNGVSNQIVGYEKGTAVKLDVNGDVIGIIFNGKEINIKQSFLYYIGTVGNNKEYYNRSSGAYIFRPNGTEVPINQKGPQVKIYKGKILTEIHSKFSDWVSQVIRLRADVDYAEFQWLVGPIPNSDGKGKEVISRFYTDIQNHGEFLTDSNGREYLMRKLNYRPSWPVKLLEKVSGNYYPVTTTISISDEKNRISLITDRAQGGSSLYDGQLELMVHRRLLHDDAFGVGEALNETNYGEGLVAIGSHFITSGNLSEVRKLVQSKVLNAWTFISPSQGLSFTAWKDLYNMEFSSLKTALPVNIQILTLEPWEDSSLLLRLEHIMDEKNESQLSKPSVINLKELFSTWSILDVQEMMLGANLKKTESHRFSWLEKSPYSSSHGSKRSVTSIPSPYIVELQPMDIKTFIINID